MRIVGEWTACDDGITRPIIRAKVLCADGSWHSAPLLVDTGADRTVFDADTLSALGLPPVGEPNELTGLGGSAAIIRIATTIRLPLDAGGQATILGPFSAVTDAKDLDMSLLGRDVTDFFAAIVDRPGNVVCLLSQRHRYIIQQQ